jgi:aminoglycoside phosphotransferase (APT) family kinase protein
MHVDGVDTSVSLVVRLLATQFPQWADLPIEPVPSAGTDNALYRLGEDKTVRLPRIRSAVGDVEREQQWLPRLAPFLPLAIPNPLAKGQPDEGYPWHWSIYRWLEGESATIERITDLRQAATDLAQFLAALRRIDPTGGPRACRGVPLAQRDVSTREAIEALRGMIDVDAAAEAWEAALEAPVWHGSPVWVHGDLLPGNLLVKQGRLSAVIDFGAWAWGIQLATR